ncbi:hypothetical protein [Deinococcus yunweiensis]
MLRKFNDWLLRRADRRLETTHPRRNGRDSGRVVPRPGHRSR